MDLRKKGVETEEDHEMKAQGNWERTCAKEKIRGSRAGVKGGRETGGVQERRWKLMRKKGNISKTKKRRGRIYLLS